MILLTAFLIVVLVMTGLWLWQRRSGRADWVDAFWAGSIGGLAIFFAVFGSGAIEKRVLVALVAGTWSFRLAHHLAVRLASHSGEDGRYQAMRDYWGERANFWLFFFFMGQALIAWLFALPAWVVSNDPGAEITIWVVLGVGIWFVSLAGESLADRQLSAFRQDPQNKGKVCQVGLWRYSRHPNYFFEWLHWFSYPLIAMGAPHQWVAWLGPALMLLFLYRVTGIPYTEKQSLKSRGEAYREYQRTTSPFIPWPPKR
jgi:steroid 5-alpha reductase family enzyme